MKYFSVFLLLFFALSAHAQVGGLASFDFLELATNARIAANGGENISFQDDDVNLFQYNPAALSDDMKGKVAINYLPFYADIKKSSVNTALKMGKLGLVGLGVQYVSYGRMEQRDINNQLLGEFNARDYAFTVAKSHESGPFRIGVNWKVAGSQIAGYNALATMIDIGGQWKHPKREFVIGMLMRNLGVAILNYSSTENSITPFDVLLGGSYKLEHMPLRFSTTIHHLFHYDVQYLDPVRNAVTDENGDKVLAEKSVSEQIARHFVFSGELLLAKGFNVRFGYNHMRRKELFLEDRKGTAGFSFGFMLKVKKLRLDYTRTIYHISGGSNVWSLTMDLNNGFKKRTISEPAQEEQWY